MMKTSMVLFSEFVNKPQKRAPRRRTLCHKTVPEVEESYRENNAHERNSLHTQASQALLVISTHVSVVQQLQRVGMQEREKNRAAMKFLVRCTHFLTRHHIAHHSTNFTKLVDIVLSCGARELQVFVENASRNALLKGQWLTLSKYLEHGSRNIF